MESSYHIPVEILYMGAHHLESPLSSRDQKFILCIKRYWTALTDQVSWNVVRDLCGVQRILMELSSLDVAGPPEKPPPGTNTRV